MRRSASRLDWTESSNCRGHLIAPSASDSRLVQNRSRSPDVGCDSRTVGALGASPARSLHRPRGFFNLPRTMRIFLACIAFVSALSAATAARASGLTLDETARLARRETVIREKTLERGERRWVGGITYTVVDASPAEITSILDNVDSLKRVLPRTKRARLVGTSSGDRLVELVQGNALMEAAYTIRVRRESREIRFWLDPSRPHGIDDAWGFFRYEPFIGGSGEPRVLLTYGVMVDVGPGIVRNLFEERLRAALLSVPQLVRRQVALSRRPT